jgi:hypothetical protein
MVVHLVVHQPSPDGISGARSTLVAGSWVAEDSVSRRLIIRTIRRDRSGSVWIDDPSNLSRPDRSGADQIDAERRLVEGEREAERLEAKLHAEVADGRHRGTSARTVGELLDAYLAWRETSGKPLSPATLHDYRTIVEPQAQASPRQGVVTCHRAPRGVLRATRPGHDREEP